MSVTTTDPVGRVLLAGEALPLRKRATALVRRTLTKAGFAAHMQRAADASLLQMFDDIYISSLPGGAAAYAGYVAGSWPTWNALVTKFEPTGAHLLSITPWLGPFARALDAEPGDATVYQAPAFWHQVNGKVPPKPVIYTSAVNLKLLQQIMAAAGIPRSSYAIWSAHYVGPHLCGPATCGYGLSAADATQYTSTYGGASLDASLVEPSFFGVAPPPAPAPVPVPAVPYYHDDEEDEMILLPGKSQPPVSKSFPAENAYTSMGLLADTSVAGAPDTQLRVVFHQVAGGWDVDNPVVIKSGAGPKTIVPIPLGVDGVSVQRLDDVQVTVIPNFA